MPDCEAAMAKAAGGNMDVYDNKMKIMGITGRIVCPHRPPRFNNINEMK